MARLQTGRGAERFESRYVRSDGVARWLEWSARPMVERGLIYAAARDVTDARMLVAELAMSRRRIVATADETRRRVERDLHDGAQHRLVLTILTPGARARGATLVIAPGEAEVDHRACRVELVQLLRRPKGPRSSRPVSVTSRSRP